MRTLLLSKVVARIEALKEHSITSCRQEESECALDGKLYKKIILQSGVNPMRRFSLDWMENSEIVCFILASIGPNNPSQFTFMRAKNIDIPIYYSSDLIIGM
jgi:hypothetical protein